MKRLNNLALLKQRRIELRHNLTSHLDNKDYDKERSNYLSDLGIKVLRFWNSEVSDNIDAVIRAIRQELGLLPAKGEVLKAEGVN